MSDSAIHRRPRGLELSILAAAMLACLLPFSGKAFHIDDTLFLWAGQQIQHHPLDFYGFDVNWYRTWEPMAGLTQNPPATSYYLAIAGSLFGWNEVALHIWMLLPAWGLVWGTYRLAERFGVPPLAAALMTLLTPATLVCSTSVMCDTMMLCFWVWTIVVWDIGLRERRPGLLFVAGGLIALTTVTKYFGVSLIPLLGVYSLAVDRRGWPRWVLGLVIAVVLLTGYQLIFHHLYGKGGLAGAADYATSYRGGNPRGGFLRMFEGLGFVGGCVGVIAACTVLLLPRWGRLCVAMAVIAAAFLASGLESSTTDEFGIIIKDSPFSDGGAVAGNVVVFGQFLLWVAAGAGVLLLSVDDLKTRRNPIALLLFLWIFGTVFFAAFVNWALNGRSILPLVPAVALTFARRLDRIQVPLWAMPALLASAAVLALTVTYADAALADVNRAMARDLVAQRRAEGSEPIWFQGHWGFQWYAQEAGARPWDYAAAPAKAGDSLVVPFNNCMTSRPSEFAELLTTLTVDSCPWAATHVPFSGAGFYASNYDWRPLPFVFNRVPPERYFIYRLTRDQPPLSPRK